MAKQKQNEITKCKHPNSRKTRALIKHVKKSSNKDKQKFSSSVKLNLVGEKVGWFRDNHDCDTLPTPEHLAELIEKYIARFNDELEQIKLKHSIGNRKNRQHASREDIINMTIKRETEEFTTCGMEIPDLLDVHQFQMTKSWNGELRFLQNFKLKRYSKKQLQDLQVKAVKRKEANTSSKDTCMVTD